MLPKTGCLPLFIDYHLCIDYHIYMNKSPYNAVIRVLIPSVIVTTCLVFSAISLAHADNIDVGVDQKSNKQSAIAKPGTIPPEHQQNKGKSQYDIQIEHYDNMIRQNPNDATLYLNKVDYLIQKSRRDEIISTLTEALSKAKLEATKDELIKIYGTLGNKYKDLNEKLFYYRKSLELNPNNPPLKRNIQYLENKIKN